MSRTLKILLTCKELRSHSGVPLYTRDVATALRKAGHAPVVYSPLDGEIAATIRDEGIQVIDDLALLDAAPDVIHGQHRVPAMTAMMQFPFVPALFVCHGVLPWQETPPLFPTLRHYVAVDALRRNRIIGRGIDPSRITTIHNFVDAERFRSRTPLPAKPARALLFSNQAAPGVPWVEEIARACRSRGIRLELAGLHSGRVLERPADILPAFDLVFARGRSALEAMAVGAAVILCDEEGFGPLVTTANFDLVRALNFGVGALRPDDASILADSLARYDPADAARVSSRVRNEASPRIAVASLIAIYEKLVAEGIPSGEAHLRDCSLAASRELASIGRVIDETEWTRGLLTDRLAQLEATPFFRARAMLLRLPGVLATWRFLRRSRSAAPPVSPATDRG